MPVKKPQVHGVILAAGFSNRFGKSSKQWLEIAGKPVIEYSLATLSKLKLETLQVVTRIQSNKENKQALLLKKNYPKVKWINGGESRCQSLIQALMSFKDHQSDDFLLVHDGARPALCLEDAERLQDAVLSQESPCGGYLAQPIVDTLRCHQNQLQTYDRRDFHLVQTPQIFQIATLKKALLKLEALNLPFEKVVDEAFLVMLLPHKERPKIEVVFNNHFNPKLTYPFEKHMVKALLS